jgi:hypothetical protein
MKIVTLALALAASGCYTVFIGEAKVPQGRKTCEKYCGLAGMELTGMVFMGEYTDGCICELRRDRGSAAGADAAGAASAAAVALIEQMRRNSRAASQQYMPPPPMR